MGSIAQHASSHCKRTVSDNPQKRIVVVDDDIILLEEFVESISSFGHLVSGFNSPVEAMSYCRKYNCDVLLSDVNMPVISGVDLAKYVVECCEAVQIILMSGQPLDLDGLPHGWTFLMKPVDIRSVLARMAG
jgi:two-component SAPR family response regulator